uniref:Uncharacterized protein n=1 Tax=Sus scrofa TaxID=9823 RepID=A0A8D1WFC3_PIG
MPKSGIARSISSSIFSSLRHFHTIFHSGCINVHSHQQYKRVSFYPRPLWHLLFIDFLMMAIVTGVKWYLTIVLIFFYIIISDIEHLFMWFLAICMSSLEKGLFRLSAVFLIGLVVNLKLSCMTCLYILKINPLSIASFANIFSYSVVVILFCLWFPLLCKRF